MLNTLSDFDMLIQIVFIEPYACTILEILILSNT